MPFLRIISSTEPAEPSDGLLRELSALLARGLGKPESYVMTCLEPRARMTFAGSDEPTCYVEVKNIGALTPPDTERLSSAITARVSAALGVAPRRVYINFIDVEPHMWGYDGGTFA